MAIKDQMQRFDIKQEPQNTRETKVTDLQIDKGMHLKDYAFQRLSKVGAGNYDTVKDKYGPLSATDPERTAKSRKDARFTLNPLLKIPLAIEEEERRVIEAKVREQIDLIAESARKEAAERGYEDGLKRGHKEAFDRWAAEGTARLQEFDGFLRACEEAKLEVFKENERFLMEVIFRLAKSVLLRELKSDPEQLVRVARGVLEKIGIRDNIRIRVSKQDAGSIDLLREGLRQSVGKMENLNIEISDDVKLGGCIVETEWSEIDASIQTQLDNLHDALLGGSEDGTDQA